MLCAGRMSPSRTSGMTSAAKRRRSSASARATVRTVNPVRPMAISRSAMAWLWPAIRWPSGLADGPSGVNSTTRLAKSY